MEDKVKLYCAIAFQFILVGILAYAFFNISTLQEMIGGAFIGLLVGIGINQIKE